MSRSIALETVPFDVAPGWIATAGQSDEEARAGLHAPFGRSGTAIETTAMIAFLASPGASYITGQLMVVDGGQLPSGTQGTVTDLDRLFRPEKPRTERQLPIRCVNLPPNAVFDHATGACCDAASACLSAR